MAGTSIQAAVAASRTNNWPQVLEHLLAAWRRQPEPELADLISAVTHHLSATPVSTVGHGSAGKAFAHRAQQTDEAEVGALVAFAQQQVPTNPRFMETAVAWAEKQDPDPRIAEMLAGFVRHPPFRTRSAGLYQRIFDTLNRIGDVRSITAVITEEEKFRGRSCSPLVGRSGMPHLREVAQAMRMVAQPLGPVPEVAVIQERLTRQGASQDPGPLFDALYAHPDDSQSRLVLADLLTDLGDPRGEFIRLQLNGKGAKRQRELLGMYGRQWLGVLDQCIARKAVVFENGFLHACTVTPKEGDVNHPMWRTVRHLTFAHGDNPTVHPMFGLVARPLQGVSGLRDVEMRQLLAQGFSGQHLSASLSPGLFYELASSTRFPNLASLHLWMVYDGFDASRVSGSPLIKQLQRLQLGAPTHRWADLVTGLANCGLPKLSLYRFDRRQSEADDVRGWMATFSFSGEPRLNLHHPGQGHPEFSLGDIAEGLTGIPAPMLSKISVDVPKRKQTASLAQALDAAIGGAWAYRSAG